MLAVSGCGRSGWLLLRGRSWAWWDLVISLGAEGQTVMLSTKEGHLEEKHVRGEDGVTLDKLPGMCLFDF